MSVTSVAGKMLKKLGCCLVSLLAAPAALAGTCASGLIPDDALGGNLGPAPAIVFQELFCVEIRNDQVLERSEIAFSSVPLPQALGLTDTDRLLLVGPGEAVIAAQFDVISRWGAPPDDVSRPIRWLQVAAPVRVAAGGTSSYSLRLYQTTPAVVDPFAATIAPQGIQWVADTGLATFVLDPDNPALLDQISADDDDDGTGRNPIYQHSPGAGPRLIFVNPGGADVIVGPVATQAGDSDQVFADGFETGGPSMSAGPVVVDAGSFEVVENGPVKLVVAVRGHFPDPAGGSLCDPITAAPYERFGYTAVFTFYRGSRDLGLEFEFRNECSDALTGPWTDQGVVVRHVGWGFPFSSGGDAVYGAGDQVLGQGLGMARVEQRRGAGAGPAWARRARVTIDANPTEAAEFFSRPLIGSADPNWVLAAAMPWLRYREPQALKAGGAVLSLEFVSDTITVGEGKGIWNRAHLSIEPMGQLPGTAADHLEGLRDVLRNRLERGLLIRAPLANVNSSGVFASLGTGGASEIKTSYRAWMDLLHAETVDSGGQFDRNKTYGSQLWPDTGSADPFGVDADRPNDSGSGVNYWDPAGSELLEFLRSGEPQWAWDFALAAYWTQLHAAYLNTGERNHGNRAGLAVTSGGPGCELDTNTFLPIDCDPDGTGGGQWHRSAFGSDDYSYAMGAELAYALRPSVGLRERFAQAGETVLNRYDPAIPEANREAFVSAVNITRQVIQHFEMLANCAEFVPGQRGLDCHNRLMALVNELARDNLAAGIFCQGEIDFNLGLNGDIPGPPAALPTSCFTPQQFMQNALMYLFFHRYFSNYGDPPSGSVRRALIEAPLILYQQGIDQGAGGSLEVNGDWASGLDCTLTNGGTQVGTCVPYEDSDGNLAMYAYNRPHTAALLLMATEVDPGIQLCQITKDAYDVPSFAGAPGAGGGLDTVHFNQAGWWKGTAQMMQTLVFGVGAYDTCAD